MKQALFNKPLLIVGLILNLVFGIAVLNQMHKWLPANDPMLENGFTWITVVITAIQLAVAVAVIRSDQRRNAEINLLTIKEKETHKILTDRLQMIELKLEASQHETKKAQEKLATKEGELSEMTDHAESLKKTVGSLESQCSKLKGRIVNKDRAIEQMVCKLGYLAIMVHELPTPAELSGPALKGLRFDTLRIAIIGFDELESFPWRHQVDFKPGMYRDFVHSSLGEGILDPKQPWTSAMILAAHSRSAA